MTQPVKFGLNVDPNTGGLAIAERITAIADASGLDLVGTAIPPIRRAGRARRTRIHPYRRRLTGTMLGPLLSHLK